MPSPFGHALAGVAVALAARPLLERFRSSSFPTVAAGCALAACAPDLDLLLTRGHRVETHSVVMVLAFTAASLTVLRLRRRPGLLTMGLVLGCAYATHLMLDWLGADVGPPSGIQALWPFSQQWFVSGLDVFAGTERRDPFAWRAIRINAVAMVREAVILGPVVCLAAWVRSRRPDPASESEKPSHR